VLGGEAANTYFTSLKFDPDQGEHANHKPLMRLQRGHHYLVECNYHGKAEQFLI
jgi:hypothetical protein